MTIQVLPPPTGGTILIYGRTYVGVAGTPVLMPDQDAQVAGANGWTIVAKQGAGATATRPTNPQKGDQFLDTTIPAVIIFDGKVWRNHATGASV